MKKFEIIGILLLSIIISFFLYSKSIPGEFVHDDALITYRYELREFLPAVKTFFQPYLPYHVQAGVWRPLSTWAVASEFILFGNTPSQFHIVNIILNGLNTWLAFLITYLLFRNKRLSFLTGLFFAFFPIHSEAVASIKSIEDLLSAGFFLLSWVFFLRATQTFRVSARLLTLSAFWCLCAVLAKETFIIGPAVILGVYAIRHAFRMRRFVKLSLCYLPVFLLYLVARYLVLGRYAFGSDDASFVINPMPFLPFRTWLFTAFEIAGIYLQRIITPVTLATSYHYHQIPLVQFPWENFHTIVGISTILIGILVLFVRKLRNSAVGIGLFVFLSSYSIVSKFGVTGGEFMGERWMYIPSFGIAIMFGAVLSSLFRIQKYVVLVIVGTFIFWYTTIVIPRNETWLSNRTFTLAMAHDSPLSVHAQYALGDYYLSVGDVQNARTQASVAHEIYADYSPLLILEGSMLGFDHKYEEAETAFLKVLKQEPNNYTAGLKLALVYMALGKNDAAVSLFDQLVSISYGRLKTQDYLFYAMALTKTRQYQKSINAIHTYVGSENLPDVRFLLAVNYFKLQDETNALKYFDWDTTKTTEEKKDIIKQF